MIPALEQIIKRGGALGVKEIIVGMSHRGRLNVLAQVLGKPHRAIFHEFKGGSSSPDDVEGSGDVKYHLGASSDREFDGNKVHLSLTANPSHLEIVNPVVLGKVRAKQDQYGATRDDRTMVMPLLLSGDAAFAGQGVIAECFGLSGLRGHRTGGSVHFIVNNQIGFTTYPRYSRSSPYPSDVAKMIEAPIFHVNGDDPEAVVYAAKIATEFRQKFQMPVVIDMFCYRRFGHNEGDEPAFTQPLMYKKIRSHPSTLEIYSKRLIAENVVTEGEVEKMRADWRARLDAEQEASQGYRPNNADWLDGRWAGMKPAGAVDEPRRGNTGVDVADAQGDRQEADGGARGLPRPSHGAALPRRAVQGDRDRPGHRLGDRASRWRSARCCWRDTPVRLSGQDSERGTFSQRHSVLIDQENEDRHTPLNHLSDKQARFEVVNSMLSEEAVLGFEYGYSLAEPNALTLWEAQFGDFANGAQVVFDQFISSGERKWLRMSGLVCLLPHGYEGQGPEHSSARLERFLQMCAEDNMQVVNFSTPANYFHALRRQLKREIRKPLIVMTPKSLLRHKRATSTLDGDGRRHLVPSRAVGRRAAFAGREDQAGPGRQDPPRGDVHRQGLLRPLRGAREARHRRHLSAARRAALSVPDQGADARAVALQAGRVRLVPGRAAQHGRVALRRELPRMGAQPGRGQAAAAALCDAPGVGVDRGRADVEASRAAQAIARRGAGLNELRRHARRSAGHPRLASMHEDVDGRDKPGA